MQATAQLYSSKGVTLTELLIFIAILGLLVQFAASNFLTQIPKQRLNGAARQVAWDLIAARLQAIKRNQNVKVTFPNNHQYTIWTDTNNDGVVDVGEPVNKTENMLTTYLGVTFSGALPPVFFLRPNGASSLATTITLMHAGESKVVSVNTTGKVTVD